MMVVGQMGEGGSGKMELGLSASLSFEVWVDFATWVFLINMILILCVCFGVEHIDSLWCAFGVRFPFSLSIFCFVVEICTQSAQGWGLKIVR